MYNHLLYLAYWTVNAIVLFLAGILVPGVKLGDGRFSSFEAAIYGGFWVTFCVWIWWDFAIARKFQFSQAVKFVVFFIVNSISILIISKFHFLTGFVLTNYIWALAIGIFATILQRMAWGIVVTKGS